MKPYFHELPKEERDKILTGEVMTVREFMNKYDQPEWCTYPEALSGHMGCWSLMYTTESINKEFCSTCDCFKIQPPTK